MAQKLIAPKLSARDATSLSIKWDRVEGVQGYKIRFRAEFELEWSPLSETTIIIKGDTVKKKNLETGKGYYFSVIPIFENESGGDWGWSPSSEKLIPALGLSPFMQQLFPTTLIKKNTNISTDSALEGKVVGVYFSASWCGPCRSFTPVIAGIYEQAKLANKKFEIVFVSCDHSEEDFKSYYENHHPWLALDFTDPIRESLMGKFQVKGIPRLCILKPSGEILVDNVGPMSISNIDSWVSQCKL